MVSVSELVINPVPEDCMNVRRAFCSAEAVDYSMLLMCIYNSTFPSGMILLMISSYKSTQKEGMIQ